MLTFTVEFMKGRPVYQQVAEAVRRAVVGGQLKAGDTFPDVHSLVMELRVHPTSARRAISDLQQEGWLTGDPDMPMIVTTPCTDMADERKRLLGTLVESLIRNAKQVGAEPGEVTELIRQEWNNK